MNCPEGIRESILSKSVLGLGARFPERVLPSEQGQLAAHKARSRSLELKAPMLLGETMGGPGEVCTSSAETTAFVWPAEESWNKNNVHKKLIECPSLCIGTNDHSSQIIQWEES